MNSIFANNNAYLVEFIIQKQPLEVFYEKGVFKTFTNFTDYTLLA